MRRATDLLLSGAKMLNLACPECDNPIYELKDGSMECANCEKKVFYEKDVDFDKSKIQDEANIALKNKIEKLMSELENEEDHEKMIKIAEAIKKLREIM